MKMACVKGIRFLTIITLASLVLIVSCQRDGQRSSSRQRSQLTSKNVKNRFKKSTETVGSSNDTATTELSVKSDLRLDLPGEDVSEPSKNNTKGWDSKSEQCREIVSQYGNDIRRVLLVGNFAFPVTKGELDEHCGLGDRVYKALRRFSTSCLTSLPRQLFSIFLRGLRKLIKSICLSNKEKERAIEILKCTPDSSLAGWNKCLNVANRQFESTAINSTDNQLFGDLCCMYNQLENCVRVNLKKRDECSHKPFEVSKFFQAMIDATLKDVMDIACARFATEDECIKNNAAGLKRLKTAADADFEVNDIFLIGPLLKIFPRLAND